MKMSLINDDNTTIKVDISTSGGNVIYIEKELKEKIVNIAVIKNPEILFLGDSISITGYCLTDKDFIYESKSFYFKRR